MLHLVTFSESPPVLRYRVPETNQIVPPQGSEVANYHDLEDYVRLHYRTNKLSIPNNLAALIQDQLCRQIPGRFCADENNVRLRDGKFSLFDLTSVVQGTATLIDWFTRGGGQRVDDAEVERRSKICATCNFNQIPAGCTGCSMPTYMALINRVVGGKTLSTDGALNGCSVCGCSLRAKVRIPLDVLRRHTSADQLEKFPVHCWMKG